MCLCYLCFNNTHCNKICKCIRVNCGDDVDFTLIHMETREE